MGTQDHPICGCCLADCPDFPGAFICRGTRQLWNSRRILKSLIRRNKDGRIILPEGTPKPRIEDIRGSVATSIETSGTHLLGKDVTRLVHDYECGATVSELAKKYGIHRATVRAHLARAGLTPRDRVPDDPNGDEYLRLYDQGIGLTTIAKKHGTTPSKVRTQLIKRACWPAGVSFRTSR